MLESLYKAIRKDAAPSIVKVGGRDYADRDLYPVSTPCPNRLVVSTLTALTDYLNTNVDGLERGKLICHVESPDRVAIRSALLGDSRIVPATSSPNWTSWKSPSTSGRTPSPSTSSCNPALPSRKVWPPRTRASC